MAVESRIKLNVNDQSVQTAIKNLAQMKTLITSFSGGDVAIQLNAQKVAMQQARIEEIQNRARIREENADNQRYLRKQETEAKISALNEQSALKLEQLQIKNQMSQNNMIASERKNVIELQKKQAQLEKINMQLENYKDKTTNATTKTNLFSNALKGIGLVGAFKILQTLVTKMTTVMQSSADYYENVNLFNITMRESNTEGEKLIQTLTNVFGLDESNLYRYMASFKGMANNMGIAEKQAYTMSSALTKMTLDLSALYNVSENDAFESLSSAITGQVKSIRDRFAGIDVSEKSLSMQLSYMGINDRTVSSLNYAEKSILRFLSIQRQASDAQGVYASEMMKPAQMFKLLGERVTKLARALGQVFIPIMNKVLPYLMATVEVLTIITKIIGNLIATLFGFDFDAFEEEGINKKTNNIKTGFDNATASAKAFKKQLQGFDVLNNITTTTKSGGGSGADGSTIDTRFLDAIKDWDMHLELASKKVQEITDNMLDWLGITKDVDKETGKVTYKLDDGFTNIKKIAGILAGATILGAVGKLKKLFGFVSKLPRIANDIRVIFGMLSGNSAAFSASTFMGGKIATVGKFLSSMKSMLAGLAGTAGLVVAAIAAVVAILIHAYKTNEDFRKSVNTMAQNFADLVKTVYEGLQPIITFLWELLKPALEWIWENLKLNLQNIYDSVVFIFDTLFTYLSGWFQIITQLINGDFSGAWETWKNMVGNIKDKVVEFLEKIWKRFKNFLSDTWDKIVELGTKLWNWLSELPGKILYWVGYAIGKVWKFVTETDWKGLGKKVIDWIINGISNFGNKIKTWVSSFFKKTKETISNIDWGQIGKNILDGIINGITNVGNKLKNWGSSFIKGIKDALGIESPSKLARKEVGVYVGLGTIKGMEDTVNKVDNYTNALVKQINKNLSAKVDTTISYANVGLPDISAINGEIMANDMNIKQNINTSSLNQKIDNLSNAMTLMQSAILKDKNSIYTIPVYIGNEKIDEHQRHSQQTLDNMYGISR